MENHMNSVPKNRFNSESMALRPRKAKKLESKDDSHKGSQVKGKSTLINKKTPSENSRKNIKRSEEGEGRRKKDSHAKNTKKELKSEKSEEYSEGKVCKTKKESKVINANKKKPEEKARKGSKEESQTSKPGSRKSEKAKKSKEEADKILHTPRKRKPGKPCEIGDKSDSQRSPVKRQKTANGANNKASKKVEQSGVEDGSSDENDWEEVEDAEMLPSTSAARDGANPDGKAVNLVLTMPKKMTALEEEVAIFVRRETKRFAKELKVGLHKVHLLCFVSHLRHLSAAVCNDVFLQSLLLSIVPFGYIDGLSSNSPSSVPLEGLVNRFSKWFTSTFPLTKKRAQINSDMINTVEAILLTFRGSVKMGQVRELRTILFQKLWFGHLIERRCSTCGRELAALFVCALRSFGLHCRLVCSVQPYKMGGHSTNSEVDSKKNSGGGAIKTKEKHSKEKSDKCSSSRPQGDDNFSEANDYWLEVYSEAEERWLTVDPLSSTECKGVVEPLTVEQRLTKPVHYVVAVDNDDKLKDVVACYSSRYLSLKIRKLRQTDDDWWAETLRLFAPLDRSRSRQEDMLTRTLLMSRLLPTVVAEFKNHPLYALERHLLKFEAIYPKNAKPIGCVRNEKVYERSDVHVCHGKEYWMREARVLKVGQLPYKVVKARPKLNVPKECREERTLSVYGFWQTEPYVPPAAENGKVPRNEHGNVELYKACMLPAGTVHLRLPGLLRIAKPLDIDCAAAVVGWEFNRCSSYPILDGWVVCAEHEQTLREAWEIEEKKLKERDSERKAARVIENWSRLLRGMLIRDKLQRKFGSAEKATTKTAKKLTEVEAADDGDFANAAAAAWPQCRLHLTVDQLE